MDVNLLRGKNIVVYDLEIKKEIEECSRGWGSFDEMGISVGCAFDYREMRYRVFMDDNIMDLVNRLNEPSTLIVAFNHIEFDNKLLRASKLPLLADEFLSNYDILLESRKGAKAEGRIPGFKLDDHLQAMNLPMKIGNGAEAPKWYKTQQIGRLVDYCLDDVLKERTLFEYIVKHGRLASAYNREGYEVKLPDYLKR